jgi:2-polyprenyl-6-methoxyphenol hydroxylase-like FAD-dependent oxidoreductase
MNTSEVVIIGAGPVGLTLGCLLKKQGIDCIILERNTEPSQHSKAFGLHARSVELLDLLDLGAYVRAQAFPVKHMSIFSYNKLMLDFDFSLLSDMGLGFVYSYPQNHLEKILANKYRELGGSILYGTELTRIENVANDVVIAHATNTDKRHFDVKAQFLVGCDGVHSTVRTLSDIPYLGKHYDESFIVVDGVLDADQLRSDLDLNQGYTFVGAKGYLMLFPLPGGMHRVVIDGPVEKLAQEALSQEYLQTRFVDRGFADLVFQSYSWRSQASLQAKIAQTYVKDRIVLAGDACHVHSPVGGQGVNLGIQDSFNLAWKLTQHLHHSEPLSHLLTYEQERRPIAATVIKNTDRLHNLLAKRQLPAKILRQYIVPLLNRCSLFKQRLVLDASGYAHAYVQQGKPEKHQILRGKRLPNVKVQSTQNESYLYQFLSSEKQTLLSFKETERQQPTESQQFHRLSLHVGDVIDKAGVYCLNPAVFKKQFNRHGVTQQQKLIVRPDGYIADVVYSA